MERFSGFFLTQSGYKHCTFGLGGEKGKTIFRVYPEIDQNGAELGFRAGPREWDFTYWMRCEKIVRRFGVNDRFTAFTRIPGKGKDFAGPIERFITALTRTFKDAPNTVPPEWLKWTEKQGPLSKIESVGLLQGMLFENAGREHKNPQNGMYKPLHPVMLVLPKSAREALETLANTEVKGYTGSPDDYASRYACGDFLSCANGKLVTFTYVPQMGTMMSHYTASIGAKAIPVALPTVKSEWTPWDNLLRFLTIEEQIALLVQYWPPDAVDFVFGHSEWADLLPGNVRGRWEARTRPVQFPQAQQPLGAVPPGYVPLSAHQHMQPQPQYAPPAQYAPQAPAPQAPQAPAPTPPSAAPTTRPVGGSGEDTIEYDAESPEISPADVGVDMGAEVPNAPAVPQGVTPTAATDPNGAETRAANARARLLEAQKAVEAARAAKK
jgi:hypothetical protein